METRWGLDLDMTAVRLMRRDGDQWSEEAIEKIDGADIEDRLKAMVAGIDTPVHLFLPRDQILYTTVDVTPDGDILGQILRALDGRTPYALDELSTDWEMIGPGNAQVAAIAYETLDEAAAFAEVRYLDVSGYSSLDFGSEFPRLPRFDGPKVLASGAFTDDPPLPDEEAETAEVPPQFASARKQARAPQSPTEASAPPPPARKSRLTPVAELVAEEKLTEAVEEPKPAPSPKPQVTEIIPVDASEPVVRVDDATPVMKVKTPSQPLNPGIPIAAPNAPPRIRTDIAASTVSGSAASLTPPGSSVRVRANGSIRATLTVLAAAFIVTIAIAGLVWTLLPLAPGRTSQSLPSAESGQSIAPAPDEQIAAVPPQTQPEPIDVPEAPVDEPTDAASAPAIEEPVASETPAETEPPIEVVEEVEPTLPDASRPTPQVEIAVIEAPEVSTSEPELATLAEAPSFVALEKLATAENLADQKPAYDSSAPLPATPASLAGIAVTAPFAGPEPDTAENTDDIYIASIESSELASDAIALPSAFGLSADEVPTVYPAPTEGEEAEQTETAAVPEDGPSTSEESINDAMAAAVAEALADALAGPGGLIPTKLASELPDTNPRPRPQGFVQEIERDRFGGRTRSELGTLRPPPRPASAQSEATEEPTPPSELAVADSLSPKTRPQNFGALVTAARVQQEAERLSATINPRAPDTSSAVTAALDDEIDEPDAAERRPQRVSIPTSASVARQATIENAISLNQVNLVGVYGAVSDRRALVRLPSGRYVKVKVGDRVDGGTVAQITDSRLIYRKGNRTLSLELPKG